ncbi:serine/threonine protein kinase [Actinocorallia sp. API 0066]|uniref:serine/threonine-protein kinase n=1 Tax=Actinocorallia sp. API 0066 TaxID=2896846 RepID=UPI001E58649A|nr:serine/threonine-protein kinase [Actinocorallia sp. API 0066]MCD0448678.1 serine/threonine protein kinase [Actinocorallia sp. API 0066]
MRALQPGDPERLGGVTLLGRIGEGGQGTVFLGRTSSGDVAVKLLHARLSDDPVARARFARESATLRRIAGFCTARVLAADLDGDRPYIVSEYVPGPSLHQLVRAEGPRGEDALMRLAVGTATALTAIHGAGVVHRDLKPPNVLMASDGPRVIDFGIARALDHAGLRTMTGQLIGTPAYMAPEQFTGSSVGPAADLFSWAQTIVFAATGRTAFPADTLTSLIEAIRSATPDLTAVPTPLQAPLTACLAKSPTDRPTAHQLLWTLLTLRPPRPHPGQPSDDEQNRHGHEDAAPDAGPGWAAETRVERRSDEDARTGHTGGAAARGDETRVERRDSGPGGGQAGVGGQGRADEVLTWDFGGRGVRRDERFGRGRPLGAVRRGRPPGVAVSAEDVTKDFGRVAGLGGTAAVPQEEAEPVGRGRLRRSWALLAGLLLVTAVSLLDLASLSVAAGGPVTELSQRWALVLATGYASLAVVTLFGVAAAWRGYRSGVWTIIAVRAVRVGLWVATLGQVPPHPATLVLQTASPALVVLLLLLALSLGREKAR